MKKEREAVSATNGYRLKPLKKNGQNGWLTENGRKSSSRTHTDEEKVVCGSFN
jgi:hypothetical protein